MPVPAWLFLYLADGSSPLPASDDFWITASQHGMTTTSMSKHNKPRTSMKRDSGSIFKLLITPFNSRFYFPYSSIIGYIDFYIFPWFKIINLLNPGTRIQIRILQFKVNL